MMIGWWIAVLILTIGAIGAAMIAARTEKYWLATVSLVPVAIALILGSTGNTLPGNASGLIVLMSAALVALATIAGSPLVALVLSLASYPAPRGEHGGILVADGDSPLPKREVLRGGTTIGYLERFAFIGSLMVGQPGAIAVMVAIKGLGRFSELENAAARERFIIGTLVSMVWAGLCTAALLVGR
ncbi:hypothetical protein FB472_0427 [Rhodoglobus vestalii]|uniref:Uncharacterized protein n=2 Tax=Rhodoglobus vestalii TaxID=193384 RepID=A0A8H2K737_9MICO|nr:hypothetical protein FB472_0427 [Rhodoglobus vestalii]